MAIRDAATRHVQKNPMRNSAVCFPASFGESRGSRHSRILSSAIGSSPSVSYTYADGQIASMSRSAASGDLTVTQSYAMSYDNFGNMVSVNVGSRNLATYSYGAANGNLSELLYANGDSLSYEYDKLERVSNVYYNDDVFNPAVSYSYSNNGSVSRVDDYAANRAHVYNYDALGRLTSMTEHAGANGVQLYRSAFDGANRLTSVNYRVSPAWNGTFRDVRTYSYTYDDGNGSLSSMGLPANGTYTYSYDALQRLTGRTLKLGDSNFLTRSYSFVPGTGTDGTTMMVASLSTAKGDGSSLNSYSYTYDDVGNITAISGSTQAQYTYDVLGQMLTETYGGKTYTYDYDEAGNIRSVSDGTTTHSYSYGDAQWKDLLTAYDGQSITYDAIGNPTSWYDGTAFTWELGRRLMSAVNSSTGLNNSYTYDADGLRLSKTVGSVEHKYVWQGGKLVSEYFGGKELEFFYDESGTPYAFSYKSSAGATPAMYYYVTNLQGDVVNILNASGGIVATYTYNAWGKVLTATGTMAGVNPLRYRGYYYDTDTGLYYLKSRYYDPEICRFINADAALYQVGSVLGCNMFAYAFNNPVMLSDSSGNWPKLSTIFAVVAAAAVTVAAVAAVVVTCGAAAPAIALAGGGIVGGLSSGTIATIAAVGTTALTVAKVATVASATSYVAEKTAEKTEKRNNSVYVLTDSNGTVQYVGRTNNVAKRAAAHNANPDRAGLEMNVIASGLNLPESRALEQAGMAYYHTLNTANRMNNQINSISPKYWGAFKELALGTLNYGWNQMSNEILYWTGN